MLLNIIIENLINILDVYHQTRIVTFYKNKKIDVVIDIGAHKGEFLKKIRRIKPKKIYAIEPQHDIFIILKKNTRDFKEVKLFNLACDKINSIKTLYINTLSSTTSLIRPNQDNWWVKFKKIILQKKNLVKKVIKIKTYKLDSILEKYLKSNHKVLIKIDVEGNELNVLKGSQKILKNKNVVFIQVENAKNNIYENNMQKEVHKYLVKQKYIKVKSFLYPTLNFSDDIYKRLN